MKQPDLYYFLLRRCFNSNNKLSFQIGMRMQKVAAEEHGYQSAFHDLQFFLFKCSLLIKLYSERAMYIITIFGL